MPRLLAVRVRSVAFRHAPIAIAVLTIAAVGALGRRARASLRPAGCAGENVPVRRSSRAVARASLLCLVDYERRVRGLPGLRDARRLDRAAQAWTEAMVVSGRFGHSPRFTARIAAAGYRGGTAGEDIATGYATPAQVVEGWMASTDHCRNILRPGFTDLGSGIDVRPVGGGGVGPGTWTIDLARPAHEAAPSHDWAPADGCPY